eukprot:COSAG02_NODE_338_length_24206_cov_94.612685_13_plen_70_part_00
MHECDVAIGLEISSDRKHFARYFCLLLQCSSRADLLASRLKGATCMCMRIGSAAVSLLNHAVVAIVVSW